ncbi:MAG: FHA domain-containing protein, partial [bacterium]|nr:FHA domain-containing protein [bacterium]
MTKKFIPDTDELTTLDITKKKYREKLGTLPPEEPEFTIGFTVIHGNEVDFGKHFNFSSSPILIGREKANSVSLEDEKVSKVHCEVLIIQNRQLEQVVIKDLDSTNGTYVNGEPVKHAVLKSGDKIDIGDTVLRFNYKDEIEEEYHSKLFTF